ncbi:hypothetical protein L2E82_44663 [Cichorium intybus]|uniref:Uncharacterized protein n=1 Tax=Cichorium intybus TaxID=13427 RepID=A0ACB8ZQY2_CICIN|nr:hypothetical protein L2E82_44663 [Cichorium intybus]
MLPLSFSFPDIRQPPEFTNTTMSLDLSAICITTKNNNEIFTELFALGIGILDINDVNWKQKSKLTTFEFLARVFKDIGYFREQIMPLELEEDSDDRFLVTENPRYSVSDRRRHSSFVSGDREVVSVSRKSVDIIPEHRRRLRAPPPPPMPPLPVVQPQKRRTR